MDAKRMRAVAKDCLAVLLVGAPLVAVSIAFLDRPLAELAAGQELHLRGLSLLTSVPGAMVPAALAVPFIATFATPRLRAPQLWAILTRLAASVIWTAAAIELILKRIFGRLPPPAWIQGHAFGFHWFNGNDAQFGSFPSGEAGITMAAISVLWLNYPRMRLLLALAAGVEAFLLVDLQWHYLGDVVGGGLVGTLGGLIAQHGGPSAGIRHRTAEHPACVPRSFERS
jgi:membrane-associated phospholipid phosphatase